MLRVVYRADFVCYAPSFWRMILECSYVEAGREEPAYNHFNSAINNALPMNKFLSLSLYEKIIGPV